MMAGLLSDLRHALRIYLRTPWQSALAIVMLATAMALVSSMASLWSDLYLPDAPGVADDRGLVTLGLRGERPRGLLRLDNLQAFSEQTQTLEAVAAVNMIGMFSDIDFEGEPLTELAEPVYPGYFQALQPRMVLGSLPAPEDFEGDGARILVLSHRFWQEQLDGDPAIVGREVSLAGEQWRVVGVADPEFSGLSWRAPAFWLPWQRFYGDLMPQMPDHVIERSPTWRIAGRMAAGVRAGAVEAEFEQFLQQLDPSELMGRSPSPGESVAMPGIVVDPYGREAARRQVSLLLAASILVAAVAAVNIGIFLLARAPGRRRELALRQTLGATRRRLSGQLVIESGLLVIAATIAGVLLSLWLAALIRELAFLSRAGFSDAIFNLPTLGMTAALAAVLTMLVALVPMALVRRRTLAAQSRLISARPGAFQYGAGLVQFSLAGLVGAAALAFLLHTWLMENRDPGLTTEGIVVAPKILAEAPGPGFRPPPAEGVYAFREAVRESILALPGAEGVSFGRPLPGDNMRMTRSMEIEGRSIEALSVIIAPGFFELLDIPILHGRGLESDDERGVIVSRSLAELAWDETDVVGRFALHDQEGEPNENSRILGVVEDVRYRHPDEPARPTIYSGGDGFGAFQAAVLVAGQVDHDRLQEAIDEALSIHLDAMRAGEVTMLTEMVRNLTAADRARALITGLFGLVIALMAGFGFFAMQRFLVDAGQRETAIRMALGAGPRLTRRHVLTQGLKLGLPGLVIGTLLAVITAAWLTDDLVTADISALAVAALVAIVLLLLMSVASLQPAIRAAGLRPGNLLKQD